MAAPTLEQTRAAASGIHSMAQADFARRKTKEAGDALTAFFVILAKKLFPKDAEHQAAARVELMLAAYFLRGDVEQKQGRAPTEAAAKKAVEKVAALGAAALDRRITDELGDAVLGFCDAMSRKVINETDDDRAKTIQLMVLAYLARAELRD